MKNLLNYCAIQWYERELENKNIDLEQYLLQHKLDGVEQYIYNGQLLLKSYADISVGVHLAYWPQWLEFWKYNKSNKTIVVKNRHEWIEKIRTNIKAALTQKPEYLVWHIADCSEEETYTFKFKHTDMEVVAAAAEVFNEVVSDIPSNVWILFENLCWPGLRLLDKDIIKRFLSLINKKNIGIILDTGHLMNTNPLIRTQTEAVDYVCRIISELHEESQVIKGLHLSCSLSGEYQQSFNHCLPDNIEKADLMKHIISLDQHRPFTNKVVQKIFNYVQPEYVVHELIYDNFTDLDNLLKQQFVSVGNI
ncbi:TIM barrel protein [Pectinatus brassicae]|uniref:Xylose isomerase-like TIM barrel domain-containing protein n=1 Tax=Pectinatus brassicae TaxID=862415 RepID=A0A840UI06_9FIRM|nr:TIM barrel protein [Pectinatus brassicae]MBB5335187.1 hypothetical protein [Pectinatus brassicae]